MAPVNWTSFDAVLFDLDGVLTPTATVHAAAWKDTFDGFLERWGDTDQRPFDDADYETYVDGKPRFDGVRDFLASRGIALPEGNPDDPPGDGTICGVGNSKNAAFLERLRSSGVSPFPGSVLLLDQLDQIGVRYAVVSSSANAVEVLEAAGLRSRFATVVDGLMARRLGLEGKPDPAIFLEAARLLGVSPSRCAVVEDAVSGVAAGRSGGFALVIGVDRSGDPEDLVTAGADVVVSDLGETLPA